MMIGKQVLQIGHPACIREHFVVHSFNSTVCRDQGAGEHGYKDAASLAFVYA